MNKWRVLTKSIVQFQRDISTDQRRPTLGSRADVVLTTVQLPAVRKACLGEAALV
jgi:hypothetical protein